MIDFALLGHPASLDHVAELLPRVRPGLHVDLEHANKTLLAKAFEWSSSFATDDELWLPRPDGSGLRGKLIICTFLPERAHSPKQLSAAYQKTRDGITLARDLGAKLVGLGGFTSIVGGAQEEKLPKELGLATTSGNSLTAALAMAQLRTLLERLGWSLADRTVAVLGATGDIGKACAMALIAQLNARRVQLIARNQFKLDKLKSELSNHFHGIDLDLSREAIEAARADIIVAATSAAQPLLTESQLQSGALVCDIGYPNTLAYSPDPRPDILTFHGGLAQSPYQLPITHYTRLPSPDLLHGCFAETLTLALAGRYESYSLGQGHITIEQMQTIFDLAQTYGFRPAPLYRLSQPITDAMLDTFIRTSQ
jgi:predicted amino acid dehydrogenase